MVSTSDRRYAKALERQDRGYQGALRGRAVSTDDEGWVSQFDGAEQLGVSLFRIGLLIASGVLEPAHNPAGQAGVTAASIEHELRWRQTAGLVARAMRAVKEALHFV
jgi:hypothetical protein